MTTYDIRQLREDGATNPIAPITVPEATKFSNGNDLTDLIGSIATIQGTTASRNFTAGEYIVRNGILYKVTTAVSSGATWGSGNSTQTSVGSEISSLSSGLTNLTVVTTTYRDFTLSSNARAMLYPTPPTVPTGYRAVLLAVQISVNSKEINFQGVSSGYAMFYSTYPSELSGNDFPMYCTWLVIHQ